MKLKPHHPLKQICIVWILLLAFFGLINVSDAQDFDEVIKAVASDRAASDAFGFSVAISGDYALVGAYSEDEDAGGINTISAAGAAYVFEQDGTGTWVQVQKLVASDRAVADLFGWSVAISGNYAIVGARREDEDVNGMNTASDAGSAYIFERDGTGTWGEVQKLVASDRAANDFFGISVSISGDYAIVGAYLDNEDANGMNFAGDAGSAYIFERDGTGTWVQVQKLEASDRAASDQFGISVSISGDYAIVGANLEDEDVNGMNTASFAGSVYVFERDGTGTWGQVQKLVASDRAASDRFGYSVSISGDYAIVGADQEDEDADGMNTASNAGSAYVFERDGTGTWGQVQKLVASDRAASDEFGVSVSISGNLAIVGTSEEDENADGMNTATSAGSAYLFERDGTGTWGQVQKLAASDRIAFDFFGISVSISGDHAIVGAYAEDEDADGMNFVLNSGSVYFFEQVEDPTWSGAVSTDWAVTGNWDGGTVPNAADNVVIPDVSGASGNLPEIDTEVEVNNLEIQSDAGLTILDGGSLTINGDLTNNGGYYDADLDEDIAGISVDTGGSLPLLGTYSGSGEVEAGRTLSFDGAYNMYSLPFAEPDHGDILDVLNSFITDLFFEYDNSTSTFVAATANTSVPGEGFFFSSTLSTTPLEISGEGTPNTGDVDFSITANSGSGGDNFNLVGNPYMAAIDADAFFTENSSILTGTAWLWNDGGGNVSGKRQGNYITVTGSGAAGGPVSPSNGVGDGTTSKSTMDWNGSFNSFQGFFVEASSAGTLTFTADMQVAGDNDDASYFREVPSSEIRLALEGNDLSDNVLVVLDSRATLGIDYSMDGKKFAEDAAISFYAVQENERYAVSVLPEYTSENLNLPLGFDLTEAGVYHLSVVSMQGFSGDVGTAIIDHKTGGVYPLDEHTSISFSTEAAESDRRFELVFGRSPVLSVLDETLTSLRVYGNTSQIVIESKLEGSQQVVIYTLDGRVAFDEQVNFVNNRAEIRPLLNQRQIYIMSLNDESAKFILK